MPLKIAGLLLLTILVYWPAMHADFVYDDLHFVVNNDVVRLGHIPFTYPRALTLASYRLNLWLGGENTFGFHMTNLLIHMASGVFVFLVAGSVFLLSENAALLAAGLFLLHPLQSEAVIYISGRSELLATLFILFSVWAFANNWYIPAVMAFGLAIMSKEIALVTPALWLLTAPGRAQRITVCVAAGMVIGLARPLWHYTVVMWGNMNLTSAYAVLALLSRAVWPFHFTIDHDFYGIPVMAGKAASGVGTGLAVVAFLYRKTVAGAATLWIIILTLPHILGEPQGYLAEHHMYAPMVGVVMLLVIAFQFGFNALPRQVTA